jgi:hypothetical protein
VDNENVDCSGSAIVCGHIALSRYPILFAERSESEHAIDSGWQFLCNAGFEEDVETAQVWSLNDVLAFEPSLKPFMGLPPGTQIMRQGRSSSWQAVNQPGHT